MGYRESPAVVQQTVATPGIAVASATTPPVARQGEAVSRGGPCRAGQLLDCC